jgi:hypothetical protein
MAPWLILLVGGIYCYIAADLFCAGKIGLSATFAGYAFSNIGLWAASR